MSALNKYHFAYGSILTIFAVPLAAAVVRRGMRSFAFRATHFTFLLK